MIERAKGNENRGNGQPAYPSSQDSPALPQTSSTKMNRQTALDRDWNSGFRAGFACAIGLLLAVLLILLTLWKGEVMPRKVFIKQIAIEKADAFTMGILYGVASNGVVHVYAGDGWKPLASKLVEPEGQQEGGQ